MKTVMFVTLFEAVFLALADTDPLALGYIIETEGVHLGN